MFLSKLTLRAATKPGQASGRDSDSGDLPRELGSPSRFCCGVFICGLLAWGPVSDEGGVLCGRVVNLSQNEAPCGGVEVLLRARVEGEFAPVAQTVADADGYYRFDGLPLGAEYLYLPGANHREIHYPGRRVALTRSQPRGYVTIEVWDTVAEPRPLVVRRHDIVLETGEQLVQVSETLLIDNPGLATYVGQPARQGEPPQTLRLGVPPDFERITFELEKFGREFRVLDGQLVTGIPWTPGPQWLRFTYTLRPESVRRGWRRALDAPCESLAVCVRHGRPDEVGCNLPSASAAGLDERAFESAPGVLPAGYEVHVQLGRVPLAWSTWCRWSAVAVLTGLIAGTAGILRRPRRLASSRPDAAV